MILVDTSVVIDYLRTADAKMFALFVANDAAICGVIRAEVLHGARSPADRVGLVRALDSFRQVPIPDTLWDTAGDHLAGLRGGGVTVPFPDAVVATVAIANDIELWTRDSQFLHIQRIHPTLRLFTEPP